MRALRRDPRERYPTAAAMKADLDDPAGVVITGICDRLVPVTRWRQTRNQATPPPLLALETHGRADGLVDKSGAHTVDTGDTVGLLSSIYPVRVTSTDPREVGEQLAAIPMTTERHMHGV